MKLHENIYMHVETEQHLKITSGLESDNFIRDIFVTDYDITFPDI
jgi:hypothetical protein